ncbi:MULTISPECIES: polyprenyl synthetase family protein [Pseudomonas]|uniref:Geranylgeranyl diphosphate synthase type II n=1 Tax=Pseudomonas hunanensis TaxID=1247546 RepID=A0ACC6JXL0_9PSED|nr:MULTISPECIES: polyprenyl synthetase family protein [Pseudomonas]MBP2262587.1 geranylgeranyl diphosphate synthase type II [Pseudomonas sp. BP8]MDR6710932.1 geranylgeranyl diphosphate synthase type II [Pseudomonas hunanensis]HDS1736911.1 polyprenyl synthetase family protein [Pseudomonas putida]
MTTIAQPLPAADTGLTEHIAHLQHTLEARLDALLPLGQERDLLAAAMRDSTLAPGKRLRPLMLMLTAEGLGACPRAALELGCAVEMVHAASLVLDDLPCMDDAALRRGRATLHRAFGEDVAILAAIALLSRAFGLLAAIETVAPATRSRLVAILAEAIGAQGLVKGQLQDLREGSQARSAEQIAETNRLKTAVLFGAIMDMACQLAGSPVGVREALLNFAGELGQAFQLYDDLRDLDPATGKDPGKDAGKSTLVAVCGESRTREQLLGHLNTAEHYLEQAFMGEQALASLLRKVFGRVEAGRC